MPSKGFSMPSPRRWAVPDLDALFKIACWVILFYLAFPLSDED